MRHFSLPSATNCTLPSMSTAARMLRTAPMSASVMPIALMPSTQSRLHRDSTAALHVSALGLTVALRARAAASAGSGRSPLLAVRQSLDCVTVILVEVAVVGCAGQQLQLLAL